MERFTNFDEMITPQLIKIIYFIGVALTVLAALGLMATGLFMDGGFGAFVMGAIYLVLGPLLVRVYAELIILGFRIYEMLRDIRDGRAGQPGM